MYIQREIGPGYNPYLATPDRDAGTFMDVGLLVLKEGAQWALSEPDKEAALLLLKGSVRFEWDAHNAVAERPDEFRHEPWCLHVPKNTHVSVTALADAEIYVQATENERDFPAKLYRPEDVHVQHAGANGELMGCMRREIKTLFDYESAPWSNMVLGEVLNYPGKWSSYPPHHHPQPEVYFHRFDRHQGFGASFANGEIYKSGHNGLTVILDGFHSQTAAPGYAMAYVWGIRHLRGDPWKKTRIDDAEHAWLWHKDANDHIFSPED
ncbi:MAG: 5-deoxy-glucuronate isomerase [Christensenellaceae bacterium]|nr:5-deoxy-glucuronate isomerase [Christensenellaceae bacterium]MEA5066958.1 5-deoxy-glucuronate isomerase [Eubacteriales bacterium]MEA5068592.1 5-deoxy-glucuronate isomerase [Christensenellaceae bacterium]